jgi:hypothetical protein
LDLDFKFSIGSEYWILPLIHHFLLTYWSSIEAVYVVYYVHVWIAGGSAKQHSCHYWFLLTTLISLFLFLNKFGCASNVVCDDLFAFKDLNMDGENMVTICIVSGYLARRWCFLLTTYSFGSQCSLLLK